VWTFFFTFYVFNLLALYFILTLNVSAIVFIVVLLVGQKIFGGYSQRYIRFLRNHIRPERFFDKCEVMFE